MLFISIFICGVSDYRNWFLEHFFTFFVFLIAIIEFKKYCVHWRELTLKLKWIALFSTQGRSASRLKSVNVKSSPGDNVCLIIRYLIIWDLSEWISVIHRTVYEGDILSIDCVIFFYLSSSLRNYLIYLVTICLKIATLNKLVLYN